MLSAFCCCGFCRDASGKSMTRFTFSAGSYRWGDDHPNALARKVKFFIKRGVVRPRHNAWTSDKGLQGKIKEFYLAGGCSAGLGLASDFWTTPQIKFFDFSGACSLHAAQCVDF